MDVMFTTIEIEPVLFLIIDVFFAKAYYCLYFRVIDLNKPLTVYI